jgi:hypothetical protein
MSLIANSFAAARLVRLWQRDSITKPARESVYRMFPSRLWALDPGELPAQVFGWRHPSWQLLTEYNGAPLTPPVWAAPTPSFVGELLSCGWCLSVWAAFAVCFLSGSRRTLIRDGLAAALGAVVVSRFIESELDPEVGPTVTVSLVRDTMNAKAKLVV